MDIFESDKLFLRTTAFILILIGVISLLRLGICMLIHQQVCPDQWVDLFGGIKSKSAQLARVNIPITLLLIGVGLRQFHWWSWLMSSALSVLLCCFFSGIAALMVRYIIKSNKIQSQAFKQWDFLESIYLNSAFAILLGLLTFYLLSKPVRALYWPRNEESF